MITMIHISALGWRLLDIYIESYWRFLGQCTHLGHQLVTREHWGV